MGQPLKDGTTLVQAVEQEKGEGKRMVERQNGATASCSLKEEQGRELQATPGKRRAAKEMAQP